MMLKSTIMKRCSNSNSADNSSLPKKKRRLHKRVQFSNPTRPLEIQTKVCLPLFHQGMTDEDYQTAKASIWFTIKDFENFALDRVQTIRTLRSLGGDVNLLEPTFCLRGLECYATPETNARLQSMRKLYMSSVVFEQDRQRHVAESTSNNNNNNESKLLHIDAELIRRRVADLSIYASERARKLALQDEKVARAIYDNNKETKAKDDDDTSQYYNDNNSYNHQYSMLSTTRRLSMPNGPIYSMPRAHVDLDKLKEWNSQMLRQLVQKNNSSISTDTTMIMQQKTTAASSLDNNMTLRSLCRRRNSLGTTQLRDDKYMPVRRDSLYGVRQGPI